MSYLLTNASALTALQNLTNTQNALSTTQSQLSTGLTGRQCLRQFVLLVDRPDHDVGQWRARRGQLVAGR